MTVTLLLNFWQLSSIQAHISCSSTTKELLVFWVEPKGETIRNPVGNIYLWYPDQFLETTVISTSLDTGIYSLH